ncbi:hypothetical protein AGMMS49592_4400 [Endomicrobiia bacterium]|nr:hypothetical protein AGMMS49592_4400 [Endomicrobiia bacterium]
MTNILILSVQKRKECAVKVQEVLTSSGCIIKTRLGIHDSSSDACFDTGIIILEIFAQESTIKNLTSQLESIDGIKSKLVTM